MATGSESPFGAILKSIDYSEDTLVEQPAIALFEVLDYETANCFKENVGPSNATLGRETAEEVILRPKLRSALEKLNPDLQSDAIELAIEELSRDRSAMSLVQSNREVYKLTDFVKDLSAEEQRGVAEQLSEEERPRAYTPELYQQKCDKVYQHVYDSYQGEGKGVYSVG